MSYKYILLQDICEKASSNITQKELIENEGTYPIYGASGFIKNVDFFQQEKEYIAIVKDGAGIGRAMKLPAKSSVIGTMQYIIPKDNINISYLYYAICSMHLEKYFSGATIPHIYFRDYKNEKLPLPPLEVQLKIAAIFENLEHLIENKNKQLISLDKLAKSRFIEMFGDEFIEVTADSVCSKIVDCPHSTPQYNEDSLIYPAIRTSEIHNGKIKWSTMKYVGSKEYEKRIKRLKPLPGDIVYAREGTYGDCVILPRGFEFCLGQRTMLFRPDFSICNSEYLHTVLRSEFVKKQADKSNAGSTVPHVNVADAKQFRFPLPPIELQNQFADFVEQVDKSKFTS